MDNTLIVFTPRSGSTFVGDVISYKNNALFLDELITGNIRLPLLNKLPVSIQHKLKHQQLIKGSDINSRPDWNQLHGKYNNSLSLIKQLAAEQAVTVKYFPNSLIQGTQLVEWAIDSKFKIFFVSRRNFERQLYSFLLAEYKQRVNKTAMGVVDSSGFVNTGGNNKPLPVTRLTPNHMLGAITTLCNGINLWHMYLRQYGAYGKTVYYEDSIFENYLDEFDISDQVLEQYKQQTNSIKPTEPYRVGEHFDNWSDIVRIAKDYNILK